MSVAKRVIFQTVSVAILALGFAQVSVAGVVSSADVINAEVRDERISKIEAVIARADVAEQLQQYGVSADLVAKRV
jgi:hypothetical protein